MIKLLVGIFALTAVSFADWATTPKADGTTLYTIQPVLNEFWGGDGVNTDLTDLPHMYAYEWGIDATALANKEIVSVTLEIDNLYNWKANENNALYIQLLNTPSLTGVKPIQDATNNDWVDNNYFGSQGINLDRLNYNWDGDPDVGDNGLYSSRTAGVTIKESDLVQVYNWNESQKFSAPSFDLSITLTESELTTFKSYLLGDKKFGLGFDADCHFYNNGIKLSVVTKPTTNVPEPTLISLLGVSLIGLAFFRRKK